MSDKTFPLGRFRKHLAYDTRVVADVALPYLDLCIGHLRVRPRECGSAWASAIALRS
jgi:hypothetical protein